MTILFDYKDDSPQLCTILSGQQIYSSGNKTRAKNSGFLYQKRIMITHKINIPCDIISDNRHSEVGSSDKNAHRFEFNPIK